MSLIRAKGNNHQFVLKSNFFAITQNPEQRCSGFAF